MTGYTWLSSVRSLTAALKGREPRMMFASYQTNLSLCFIHLKNAHSGIQKLELYSYRVWRTGIKLLHTKHPLTKRLNVTGIFAWRNECHHACERSITLSITTKRSPIQNFFFETREKKTQLAELKIFKEPINTTCFQRNRYFQLACA